MTTRSPATSGLPDKRMAALWLRMTSMFGGRWTSQYGDRDDGTWAAALSAVASAVLGDALGRVAAAGGDFPPTLGGFLAICARAYGLPDPVAAYRDAAHLRWTHIAVYETARRVGIFELRNRSEREMLPVWREEYGLVCQQAMAGANFQPPKTAQIEESKARPACTEPAQPVEIHMATMRRALGVQAGAA